jgi:hypothetical protein
MAASKQSSLGEDRAQKEAMLGLDPPFERLLELGDLAPQLSARKVGDDRDILLTREPRLQHLPSTHAEHIAGDSCQLDIGAFQHPSRRRLACWTRSRMRVLR